MSHLSKLKKRFHLGRNTLLATWNHAAMWGSTSSNTILFPTWSLSLFSFFWSNFHAVVWRPFWAPISSKSISLESFGCLVPLALALFYLELRSPRYRIWKRGNVVQKILQHFYWKIHLSKSIADIVKLFLLEVVKTLYFNLM